MTARKDLLLELNASTDSGGNYTGDWVETCDVFDIRVIANKTNSGAGVLYVEEANLSDGSGAGSVIYVHSANSSGGQVTLDVPLTARFFRVRFVGFIEGSVQAAVRAISRSESHGLV